MLIDKDNQFKSCAAIRYDTNLLDMQFELDAIDTQEIMHLYELGCELEMRDGLLRTVRPTLLAITRLLVIEFCEVIYQDEDWNPYVDWIEYYEQNITARTLMLVGKYYSPDDSKPLIMLDILEIALEEWKLSDSQRSELIGRRAAHSQELTERSYR